MKKLLILLVSLLPFTARSQDTLYNDNHEPIYVKYNPVPPIPPTVYTDVDNFDAKIVYTPLWAHNGTTTATGFHNNTMAYDATAGRTATLVFTGTSIEVFCEKKVGHGSAAFQVDGQAAVTVPLGVDGPIGSTSVFKAALPAGQHTFKLTVVGSGNVVFDYVKINGVAVTPPVTPIPPDPIPPIPPSGNVVTVTPSSGYVSAVQMAAPGTTVRFLNGTYPVTLIQVPVGVRMEAESRNAILVYNGPTRKQEEIGIVEMVSGSKTDGKQSISGFTIKGNNSAAIGVRLDYRDNVNISDIRFEEFTFGGVFVKNSENSHVFNSSFFNCSWSSPGWASAEAMFMDIKKCSLHHNSFTSDKISEGYAMKAYGSKTPKGGVLEALEIYNNSIDMFPGSNWNNNQAPNIGLELHDVTYAGIYIHDNYNRNTMSLASHLPSRAGTRTIVERNDFDQKNGAYAIELVCSNITVRNNTGRGFSIFTANYNPNSLSNGHWTDQIIENNNITFSGPPPNWAGNFLLGMGGADMIIRNNILTNSQANTRVKHTGPTSASNIVQTGNTPPP